MTLPSLSFTAKFAGQAYEITLPEGAAATLADVAKAIHQQTGLDVSTLKLLGIQKGALVPAHNPEQQATAAGIRNGIKVMVMGSKAADVSSVKSAKGPERMRGFEEEALLAASRRRTRSANVQPPPAGTKYTFGGYEVMKNPSFRPGPEEAMKLLYRLASDPGILHIMEKHQFTVGKLAEMPPEGLVGVDPVCVLGYNTNRGQTIHLRLRTDDLKGFRKYESIRATLCHELTHNVWGDHDSNFKQLCSQLNREVEQVHASRTQGARFAALQTTGFEQDEEALASSAPLHPAMAATSKSSGKTLRQLTQESHQASKASSSQGTVTHRTLQSPAVSPIVSTIESQGINTSPGQSNGVVSPLGTNSGNDSDGSADNDVATMFEHHDDKTEELEAKQRALEH